MIDTLYLFSVVEQRAPLSVRDLVSRSPFRDADGHVVVSETKTHVVHAVPSMDPTLPDVVVVRKDILVGALDPRLIRERFDFSNCFPLTFISPLRCLVLFLYIFVHIYIFMVHVSYS